jgi:hypothetical protein
MQSLGVAASSSNLGSGAWLTSFQSVAYAASPIADSSYFTAYGRVRIVDGDGSADDADWAVFNFGVANGNGDFSGNAGSVNYFGGESESGGSQLGSLAGQVWGYDLAAGTWVLLYQLPLGYNSGTSYNHLYGAWFVATSSNANSNLYTTAGGGGNGKYAAYDWLPITYIGFSVSAAAA